MGGRRLEICVTTRVLACALPFVLPCVLASASRPARASLEPDRTPAIELRWDAPAPCPDRSRIDAEIVRFLADGAQRDDAPVVIDARVTRAGEKFVLALKVQAPSGAIEKTMRADDCRVLASAVALVVAVLLDPTAVVETVERERTALPVIESAPVVDASPTAPVKPPRRKLEVQGLVRPFVVGSFGPLPRFGVATGGLVGIRVGRARVEAHAIWEAPQRATAREGAGARIDLWAIGPRGCFAPRWRTLEVPVCAGGEVGRMRGLGFGLSVARRARATWAAMTVGAALLWVPLRWLAVGGGVDGVVALTRPSFVIDDLGRIHRPRPVGVRIHAGLEVRFP